MNQSWSIIILVYNEEETISSVFFNLKKFLIENYISEFEIIIVNDGSNDNSEKIIMDIKEINSEVNYIRHPLNLGIGKALLSGYKNAVKENVIMIPGDGQFDITELSDYKNFPENTFLSFYRGDMSNYTLFRKTVSNMNMIFNKYFLSLSIKDVNWVKSYKTKDLKSLNLQLESSLVGSEICAKLNLKGIKATEILSEYHKRIAGKANGASAKNLIKAFRELIKLVTVIRKYKENLS